MKGKLQYAEEPVSTPCVFRAANILGNLGNRSAVPALIDALEARDSRIRNLSAYALGRLHDPRAVEPLIRILFDPLHDPRRFAAGALGYIGDQRAVEPLLACLEDGYKAVREAACEALQRLTGRDHGDKVEGPDAATDESPELRELEERVFKALGEGNVTLSGRCESSTRIRGQGEARKRGIGPCAFSRRRFSEAWPCY